MLTLAHVTDGSVTEVLGRFGLELVQLNQPQAIPGSYWGESEAGIVGNKIYARHDTPVHSVLHEACHVICMSPDRRAELHTDAGGDYDEENAVCFLQVLLSEALPAMGREKMFSDMDAWGYSFRLGSAKAWFESDAQEVRDWLVTQGVIRVGDRVQWVRRGESYER